MTRWRGLVALFLLAVAMLWFWSSLATVATFALRYPAFDQYRLYSIYLGLPFPANAVQLENGHRPILPALLRLAEVHWLDANQILQVIVGLAAAITSLVLLVRAIARERSILDITSAASIIFVVLALFWLGNARVLIHGDESVQMYLVVLCVVLAILTIGRTRTRPSAKATALTCASCVGAAFTFGTGMASFGAATFLGAIARWRAGAFAALAVAFIATSSLYLLGLPGGAGIRHTLLLAPRENFAILLRWLSAPWMCAWLGHGDPLLAGWWRDDPSSGSLAHIALESARSISAIFGDQAAMQEGLLIGTFGATAFVVAALDAWRHRARLSSVRFTAIGLSTFALGAAVIICVARLDAFRQFPGEVFADRYLPWSSLFWLGLALYALDSVPRKASYELGAAFAAIAAVILFLPSQSSQAGWSATVFRDVQQSAAAAQLGVWDPEVLPDDRSSHRDSTLRSLGLLRERGLAMFAEPEFKLMEADRRFLSASPSDLSGVAHVTRVFHDSWGNRDVAAFEGLLPKNSGQSSWMLLAVIDADGALRGLAKQSFITYAAHSLRLTIPKTLRGFGGYVTAPRPGEKLTILALDPDSLRVAATVPLLIPPSP